MSGLLRWTFTGVVAVFCGTALSAQIQSGGDISPGVPPTPTSPPTPTLIPAASTPAAAAPATPPQWEGEIPKHLQNIEVWKTLLTQSQAIGAYDLSFLIARRMVLAFQDLDAKTLAYRTLIDLIDRGYSIDDLSAFAAADLEPSDEDPQFANSYNLYKFITNHKKGLERWAKNYEDLVDKEKFPKYFFYRALEAYSEKNFEEAEKWLRKILEKPRDDRDFPLVKKSLRTLARIAFEQKRYGDSLDIYTNFLLRLNPVEPDDYLEAAWNYFHLKQYAESMGMIVNTINLSQHRPQKLELITLRSLIARALCKEDALAHIAAEFDAKFKDTLKGIQEGRPLFSLQALEEVAQSSAAYRRPLQVQTHLDVQAHQLQPESVEVKELLSYLINSERKILSREIEGSRRGAYEKAAEQLVTLSEQLRFLKFDIVRQRINPKLVFAQPDASAKANSYAEVGDFYRVRWPKMSDTWRDERLQLRGVVQSECAQ